jgi:hypothetical protein
VRNIVWNVEEDDRKEKLGEDIKQSRAREEREMRQLDREDKLWRLLK